MPSLPPDLQADMEQALQAVLRNLEGLDYALDWRENPQEWSARDIVDHLLGTESSGILYHLRRALRGEPLIPNPGRLSRSPERRRMDIRALRQALEDTYREAVRLLREASPEQVTRPVPIHRPQGIEMIDALGVVRRFFIAHWHDHARQLASVRERLGIVVEE
ncbi:MAG: DinB family protein [Dehalococcoidia bacterium]|nr:DinB family protein [Dehalococcoidia bacterium]MDW8119762.1 DinB family protein [Chloroflexota bacterium]